MKFIIEIDDERVLFDIQNHGFTAESETDKVIIDALYNGVPLAECDDCVSRKAIYRTLNKWDWQDAYLPIHFKELVEDLPPVQPTRKRETSAFVEKYKNAMQEGCCLDQGITQGIV